MGRVSTAAGVLALSLCSLSVAAEPAAATAPPSKTHMMWHLAPADGATPELATRVEKTLREFLTRKYQTQLMDGLTMDSLLLVEGNEKYLRCGTGAACLAGLGDLAGMRWVIAGQVGLRDGRTITSLVLVDTGKKQVTAQASVESVGPPGTAAFTELAVAMFDPGAYRGSIELAVAVEGAEVYVDGQKVGLTPLPGPLVDLPAGERLVEVRKMGRQAFSRTVRVPLGNAVRVVALLPEAAYLAPAGARPFYKDWPFWTAAGVGAAALVTAGILHKDAMVNQDNADVCRRDGADCYKRYQDKADSRYLQAYVIYGLGGAGLLAAGLIAVLDVALEDGTPAEAKRAPTLAPAFAPGGLALDLVWQF